jgi:arabinoxylan arabinofuranohydrolase
MMMKNAAALLAVTCTLTLAGLALLGCPADSEEKTEPPPITGTDPALEEQPPAEEIAAHFSGLTLGTPLKAFGNHNPLITHNFGADPWAMPYNGRVYMYLTGDALQYDDNGGLLVAAYGKIRNLHLLSSADLVNWQDHGAVTVTGPDGLCPWANGGNGNFWAPCAAYKTIGGKDRFFIYWADSSRGIGVLMADSPVGPWKSPLKKLLIDRDTPTCSAGEVPWLFDPAVLVEDNGDAYLYFGGGVDGLTGGATQRWTKAARVVKLGANMISLAEDPHVIDNVEYLFEDSGINKMNGKYYYSYCTNWQSANGFTAANIAYMVGDTPYGPFTYKAQVLNNPKTFFAGTNGSNNHHSLFEFKGKYYMAYHTQTLEKAMKDNGVLPAQLPHPTDGVMQADTRYRNPHIDAVTLNADGSIANITGTMTGVEQVGSHDPYQLTEAETIGTMAGINIVKDEDAASGVAVAEINNGDWLAVYGVDFGETGANKFSCRVKAPASGFGAIQVRLDSPTGEAAAYAYIQLKEGESGGGYSTLTVDLPQPITGVHNLVFVFYGEGWNFDQWQFIE